MLGILFAHNPLRAQSPKNVFFISQPPTEAFVGLGYGYQPRVQQTVASLLPPTFFLVRSPEGMSIDPRSGRISWLPRSAGAVNVAIGVSLGNSSSSLDDIQEFTVVVREQVPQLIFPMLRVSEAFHSVEWAQRVYAYVQMPPAPAPFPPFPTVITTTLADSNRLSLPVRPFVPQISYRLLQAPQGMTIDSTSGLMRWTPPVPVAASPSEQITMATVTVQATARITSTSTGTISGSTLSTLSASQTFRISVFPTDSVRIGFLGRPTGMQVITGQEFSFTSIAAYGRRLIMYNWFDTPEVRPTATSTATPTTNDAGNTVSGVANASTADDITLTPYPIINPEARALRYELLNAPEGMAIDASTGTVRWKPALGLAAASLQLTVRASLIARTSIATTQTISFRLTPREDLAVTFTTSPPATANAKLPFQYDAQAFYNLWLFGVNPYPIPRFDSGRVDLPIAPPFRIPQNLTYTLVQAPEGMNINPTTGTVTWLPRETGSVQVRIRAVVTTNATLSSTQTFTLRVQTPPPTTLAIVSRPPTPAQTGREWTYVLQTTTMVGNTISPIPTVNAGSTTSASINVNPLVGTDPMFPANAGVLADSTSMPVPISPAFPPVFWQSVRFSLVQAPPGMTIDSVRGFVTWTPRDTGTVQVGVRAVLWSGSSAVTTATQTFALRVVQGPCATVQGTVRFSDGSLVLSGLVQVLDADNPTRSAVPASTTIRNGSYTLEVPPGRYTLMVAGGFVTQTTATFGITCGERLRRDFRVERPPVVRFFLVTGNVTSQVNNAPVRAFVEFIQRPENPNTVPPQRSWTATTQPDGSYSIALPDNVSFTARATPLDRSLRLLTVYYNGTTTGTTDATRATAIRLTGDTQINFALAPGPGSVPTTSNQRTGLSLAAAQTHDGAEALATQSLVQAQNAANTARTALVVAPNPSGDATTLHFPTDNRNHDNETNDVQMPWNLTVVNALGVVMFTVEIPANQHSYLLHTASWTAGNYMVRLQRGTFRTSTRLLVAR
jgi:hypothetical protein